ncbi:Rz1-like lysis system protein LysC [Photobacterium kishitanii]|uniref:Rz1-like lysis system protein LysC n=1 Tax=Photobacterium kishitanii TaxID=318456 RepID=UPI003B971A0C
MIKQSSVSISKHLRKHYQPILVLILATLSLLLSGCTSPTSVITKTETLYVLPPIGLVVSCYKPTLTATTPAELPIDTLKLKSALRECVQYVDDYLNWRKLQDE